MKIKNLPQFLASLILLIGAIFVQSHAFAQTDAVRENGTPNVKVSLISEYKSAAAGSKFHIALVQKIAPEWHTYWRNPGDVGDATRINWTAPKGVQICPIKWPSPDAIPYEGFINYGYSREVVFPMEISIAPDQTGPLNLKAQIEWLECKDVCVPGDAELELQINIAPKGVLSNGEKSIDAPIINAAIGKLPIKISNQANYDEAGENILLGIKMSDANTINAAQFFPFEIKAGALINHAAPQKVEIGSDGVSLHMEKSKSYPAQMNETIGGVLKIERTNQSQYYEISASKGKLMPNLSGQTPKPIFNLAELLGALGFAFLGGLILNLMPCVFPILAMKIIGLTKAAHGAPNEAREYGIFYGAGVIATFSALGALLFTLKHLGDGIGWGFQLQNPIFLLLVMLLIVAMGFNLLGLFEVGASLQGIGAKSAAKSGKYGAFASGALAVAVASPCTAPFMGGALGYAAIATPLIGLLVFVALGFGFALPFVVLTFAPKLLAYLPKPGPWMERLKQILAIPMFLTAAWLLWVLYRAGGIGDLLPALFAIFGLAFMLIMQKINPARRTIFVSRLMFVLLLGSAIFTVSTNAAPVKSASNSQSSDNIALGAQPWSDEKVAQLTKSGKIVFVNFTADWCITCKVNENTTFHSSKVQAAFKAKSVSYLVADWTKKDEIIARALSSHGRIGVPLYLIYFSDRAAPVELPQLLSADAVIKALEEEK